MFSTKRMLATATFALVLLSAPVDVEAKKNKNKNKAEKVTYSKFSPFGYKYNNYGNKNYTYPYQNYYKNTYDYPCGTYYPKAYFWKPWTWKFYKYAKAGYYTGDCSGSDNNNGALTSFTGPTCDVIADTSTTGTIRFNFTSGVRFDQAPSRKAQTVDLEVFIDEFNKKYKKNPNAAFTAAGFTNAPIELTSASFVSGTGTSAILEFEYKQSAQQATSTYNLLGGNFTDCSLFIDGVNKK